MFDNLPFTIENINTIEAFLNSELLEYKTENMTPNKEGVLLRTTYSKFKNLTIAVKYNENGQPVKISSTGSFHYLMNNGIHNANQFPFSDMKNFLLQFEKDFNIDLKELKLAPPEFAVNFQIPFDVEKVVQNTFYEQRKPFINNSPGNPSKISGKHSNECRLKVYSKYHQQPTYCKANTLRLEYQAKKIRRLQSLGISTLKDLLKLKNWIKLRDLHLSYFKHLVLYDYTIKIPKNSKYKKRIADLSNFIYWENLVKNSKIGNDYETKYNEEVKLLNSLSKIYGANLLHKILLLAEIQWNKNLNTCFEYSHFKVKKLKDAPLLKLKDAPFITCNPCKYFKHNKDKISTKRICKVTGLNISMQRDDSFKLSHTGLKYYYKTDRKIYDEVKRKYLTAYWVNEDHKTQIKAIAHNIRNSQNNLKLKQQRLYPPGQTQLFDLAV